MSSFRFLHAADLHLDSPLRGLQRYDGLPLERIRGATRGALDNLVNLAIDRRVDFLVIAGDLYDGTWKDAGTGLYMARALGRLVEAGIRVYILQGNHDAASLISRDVPLPPGVQRFSTTKPETFRLDDLQVALHGQGFESRQVVSDMTPAYPPPVPGWFNIGVLHTSLGGYSAHETYAPCAPETLFAKGYDYWALGHVHERMEFGSGPYIVFPGVLQGRHIHESGPKGATLVTVENGRIAHLDHCPCDVLRWAELAIDCAGMTSESALHDAISTRLASACNEALGDRLLVARLTLGGATSLDARLRLRASGVRDSVLEIAQMLPGTPAIEKVEIRTTPPPKVLSEGETEGMADIRALIAQALADPLLVEEARSELAPLLNTLSSIDMTDAPEDALALARADEWARLLTEATHALDARLGITGDDA